MLNYPSVNYDANARLITQGFHGPDIAVLNRSADAFRVGCASRSAVFVVYYGKSIGW